MDNDALKHEKEISKSNMDKIINELNGGDLTEIKHLAHPPESVQ